MPDYLIALFGEAEKGDFHKPYFFESVTQMAVTLGLPPQGSFGLEFAVKALLYKYRVLFFRVEEEGYSTNDYLIGLHFLQNRQLIPHLTALCMPKVSAEEILQPGCQICALYKSFLITCEYDLYDCVTSRPRP